jgi:hypothetical protein
MTHDSLIESTISTISKNCASCVSKISLPSMLTVNTEMTKRSAKYNANDFYPKNFNHVIFSKLCFECYRNDAKKRYEYDNNKVSVNEYQMPDQSNTFMKIIKGRANTMSATNDERHQILNPRVIWDGSIDRCKVFRNNVESP